jgi:hypothetical protein
MKKTINQELEVIKEVLKPFRHGASIEDVRAASGLDIGLRTLQRRLETLQEQGYVQASGQSRAMRYYLVQQAGTTPENSQPEAASQGLLLSAEGREIQGIVTQPEQNRQPVGYNRDFLYSYRPNIDSYLTDDEKDKLAETGKTGSLDQPAGTYAKEILQRLLIDLAWNSSRLEGNTYSLLDTQRLISFGDTADNKSEMDAQMILNHKGAIEFIVQDADEIGLNRYTILNLHALLSNNLLPNPAASGRLRTFAIGITKSVYTPLAIPQQIEELFERMLEKASQIRNPFEQAFFIMVQLPYLQPFDDVNKRVTRLAANIPLNRFNLAPLSFVDVPNDIYTQGMIGIYELNRVALLKDVFMWAYGRSAARYAVVRQSIGEPDPFRLKYREEIQALIAEIVSNAISLKEGNTRIETHARELPKQDQPKFIETVETELLSLHEGNFARYRIRPAEYKAWRTVWPE